MTSSGPPEIPIFKPQFSAAEADAAKQVVESGWIAIGGQCAEFEVEVGRMLGVDPSCVVSLSSGTAALHLALILAGIGPGDEVLVPALGFIATANAVTYCGADVKFVDVDTNWFTSGVDDFASAVTERTKAIVPVHVCGRMAPMPEIVPWAHSLGLTVVEDAAPAMSAAIDGVPAGTWGDYGCFSLHSSKPITTGEGGLLITPADRAGRARSLRFHGADVWDFTNVDFGAFWEESYVERGYNYRLTDLQAAIGRVQLAKLGQMRAQRLEAFRAYNDRLRPLSDALTLPIDLQAAERTSLQQYVIQVRSRSRDERDAIIASCRQGGAFAMPGVSLVPSQPQWRHRYDDVCANAVAVDEAAISLPFYPGMTAEEIDRVTGLVSRVLGAT